MPRELDRSRPASSISALLDSELVQEVTQATVDANSGWPSAQQRHRNTSERAAGATSRTGEAASIQKMYRLTPATYTVVRELAAVMSESLGYDLPHSAAIRSLLLALAPVLSDLRALSQQRMQPRRQLSTAVGNEHLRDALEAEIAQIITAALSQPI